ncbi:FAD-dependent oxidoreductase, partial [Streptomyces galilaeus]
RQYKSYGVDILTSTKVDSVTDHGDKVTVAYTGKDGATGSIDADRVLMSIGFAPKVDGFGLENTGVKLTERGAIDIDDH